ncbi:MAG: hypothetical protein Rsou_1858 [Candidatus Ruthia sp. Asou_11_S2]|nr:hypothetical protein [Candidatus Ruthia sp. Asou_11_S2]
MAWAISLRVSPSLTTIAEPSARLSKALISARVEDYQL